MTISDFTDFMTSALTSSVGAVVGTCIKLVQSPPDNFGRWFAEAFMRIAVGTFAGGVSSEWFQFGPWVSSSVAAAGAYIADEILRAMNRNASRLKHVEPPLPFEKDHEP